MLGKMLSRLSKSVSQVEEKYFKDMPLDAIKEYNSYKIEAQRNLAYPEVPGQNVAMPQYQQYPPQGYYQPQQMQYAYQGQQNVHGQGYQQNTTQQVQQVQQVEGSKNEEKR